MNKIPSQLSDLHLYHSESLQRPAAYAGVAGYRSVYTEHAKQSSGVVGSTFTAYVDSEISKVINSNESRVGFSIQNESGFDIYVSIGNPPSISGSIVNNAFLLNAGGFYEPFNTHTPTGDIFCVCLGGTAKINIIELTG